MDDGHDMSRDTVMLTYEELAGRLDIDVQSARRRALRHRWPKTRGNDGKARVAVPATVLPAAGAIVAATNATPAAGVAVAVPAAVAVTPEVLSHLLSQVGEVAELRERLGRAEGEAMARRDAEAHARAEAAQERQERERAVAERDAARDELAMWLAGGPLARAWRVLAYRRGRP